MGIRTEAEPTPALRLIVAGDGDAACASSVSADPDADALAELLRRAGSGDERAWRELVSTYGRRVFALIHARCRRSDVAEEIVQSVFVTVAIKLREGAYTESGRFEAWLFRIAVNRLRDEMRRGKRRGELIREAAERARVEAPSEDDRNAEEAPELSPLRAAVARLSEADRDIIELRHHAGMSFKDIAALRGEPLGTLLARHHRALRKLRQWLEPGERSGGETGTRAEGGDKQ